MKHAALAALLASWPVLAADQHLVEGAAQSPVRVLIYEDLQCPDCAVFHSMLETQLLPRYASTVRFEHRDFPLAKHAWARKAAIAARFFEEAKPGLGLEYRKYAMEHQSEITADNFNHQLAAFAKAHGTDPAQALGALGDQRLADFVEKDFQEGVARGIAHTPTVLVNGKPFIETFSFQDVAAAIDSQLAAAR
ncbi:MAG TPA: thioredoxin domain-containing protein [Bryobacteraceae bacterium]|nr:thioredoxin domain-containing protein [Bryobacteraceae bacterium]